MLKRVWVSDDVETAFTVFDRLGLIKTRGHRCEECQGETWLDDPIPLVINHIDGNRDNDAQDNVCVMCPNCHSFTPDGKRKIRMKDRLTVNMIVEKNQ